MASLAFFQVGMRQLPISVSGIQQTLANLRRLQKTLLLALQRGYNAAGRLLKDEADKTCPEDLGNLRKSAYVASVDRRPRTPSFTTGGRPGYVRVASKLSAQHGAVVAQGRNWGTNQFAMSQPAAEIGYTAYYAIYVHENPPGMRFQRAGARKFWLQRSAYEQANNMVDKVILHARRTIP